MSSLNDYIKFALDIKDQNIIFFGLLNENINGKTYKIYLAKLIYYTCPFCHFSNLKPNDHYNSKVRLITDIAKSDLKNSAFYVQLSASKDQ